MILAYVLRAAVEGWEPYTLILTDSLPQARKFVTPLKAELEHNPALRAAYPLACGRGPEWRSDAIRLRNGSLVEALSRGSKVRGRKDHEHRPSLIVIDDCQNNRDVISPADRTRALEWFLSEVVPAGSETTNFVSVGSALHRDAVAVTAQTLPGWTGRTFPAVLAWPDNMDLWDEWGRRATNLADDDRAATAAAYLAENLDEMSRGGASFWPTHKPIRALMHRRAEIGPRRFDTEYQGNPGSPEGAEWPPEYFDWSGFWFTDWPAVWGKAIYFDGSKGKDGGDYQCYAVLGVTKDPPGHLWAELHLIRMPAGQAVGYGVEQCRQHKPDIMGIEDNFDAGVLLGEFGRQFGEARVPLPPLFKGLTNTAQKDAQIRRLDPYLSRKQLHVKNTGGGRLGVEQLRQFPNGAFDDAPDAVEGAMQLLANLLR